jgi:hypothetical protein
MVLKAVVSVEEQHKVELHNESTMKKKIDILTATTRHGSVVKMT